MVTVGHTQGIAANLVVIITVIITDIIIITTTTNNNNNIFFILLLLLLVSIVSLVGSSTISFTFTPSSVPDGLNQSVSPYFHIVKSFFCLKMMMQTWYCKKWGYKGYNCSFLDLSFCSQFGFSILSGIQFCILIGWKKGKRMHTTRTTRRERVVYLASKL